MASAFLANLNGAYVETCIAAASLASAGTASSRPGVRTDLLLWIGVLIVVVVIGGLVLVHMQKRLLKPPASGPGAAGLMEDLRRMRDTGAMTHEEYDAARKAMARKLAPSGGSSGATSTKAARTLKRRGSGGEAHLGTGGSDRDSDVSGFDSGGGDAGGGDGGGGD